MTDQLTEAELANVVAADRIEDLTRINAELRRDILAVEERCEILSAVVDDLHLTIAGQRHTIDAARQEKQLLEQDLAVACEEAMACRAELDQPRTIHPRVGQFVAGVWLG